MPKDPLYTPGIPVPEKKVAAKNPYPQPVVGAEAPHIVPYRQPRITGLAAAHGYGHLPKHKEGHLRMSGHKGAHRIGTVPKPKKEP